jgi:hypothetical protein
MAVGSFLIAIQASYADGRPVTRAEFINPLHITAADPVEHTDADGGQWQSGLVYFPLSRLSEFKGKDEPHEKLFAKLEEVQKRIATFLDGRDPAIFEQMRRSGMKICIFIDVRMNQDQMELPLEASFIAACGRHGLPIFVISNDISAAEALAARPRHGNSTPMA